MFRTVAFLVALSGMVACSSVSDQSGNSSDQSGQSGFTVGAAPPPGAGFAGSQASPPPTMTPQAGAMAPVPSQPPNTGVAGTQAPPAMMPPAMQPPAMMPDEGPTLAMDECDLDTQWMGDEYCILPPPADEGFQLRVGPSNYDNPERQYLVAPGEELTESVSAVSGNTEDVYYYWRQYRMRPGSHHMILSRSSGGIGGGGRMGGAQTPAKDSPTGGVIPPENAGVGMQLGARTPLNFSLHYFNFTDQPILKDVWVNVWYRDPSEVTEAATEMFSMLSMPSANITPGRHAVISGNCDVTGSGRILTVYGHRHANNLRFSVWHERGAERTLLMEDYDWHEPATLEFSSLITNKPPDPATKTAGGHNGVVEVQDGDSLYFECEVINMTNRTFLGANEAMDDEMCIMIGDVVGASVQAFGCDQDVRDVR